GIDPRERADRIAGSDASARRADGALTEAERAAIRGEDSELEARIERALADRARRCDTSTALDAAPSPHRHDIRPEQRDIRPERRDIRPEQRDTRPEQRDTQREQRDTRPEKAELEAGKLRRGVR